MLSREGADVWILGRVYVLVVQAVMLYGSETWVMIPHIGRFFGRIPPQVVLQADGKTSTERTGRWMRGSPSGVRDGRFGIT